MFLKTIVEDVTNEILIKNSRFITKLVPITDKSNIASIIHELKMLYPKASHYCYAYIRKNDKGCSDDGEPASTAGRPMLNVLEKEKLINVIAIVIRYFGGIKLGTGGLVRAYSKSILEALSYSNLVELEEGYKVRIIANYDKERELMHLLKDCEILEKEFTQDIMIVAIIPKTKLNLLTNYHFQKLEENYIKKIHLV